MTWRDGECWATRVDSAPHVPSEAVDVVYTSDVLSCQGHGRSVGASATPAQWATRAGALLFCMCCDSRRRAPRVGASRALPALLDETRRLRGFVASLLMVVSSRVLGALVTGLVSARHAMLYARDARRSTVRCGCRARASRVRRVSESRALSRRDRDRASRRRARHSRPVAPPPPGRCECGTPAQKTRCVFVVKISPDLNV